MSRPRVLVVSLGGTITMTSSGGGGVVPTLGAADLVAGVPQLGEAADLEAISRFGVASGSLTLANLLEVAAMLRDRFASGSIDGAVVVQGTDTIEDTAFVLDLLVGDGGAVVVTGAMRSPQTPGADGPANLLAAVRAAADPQLRSTGVVVVVNDEIHAARFVQKAHTALTSAFASPSTGRIGIVAEGRVQLDMLPLRGDIAFDLDLLLAAPPCPVAQVPLGLDDDGRLLGALPGLGYRAAVIEAVGAGHVAGAAVANVERLVAAMPVVLATRVRSGPVFTRTYGYPGSEMDLIARGVIASGSASASKTRLLLTLLVASGHDRDAIRRAFATAPLHGAGFNAARAEAS